MSNIYAYKNTQQSDQINDYEDQYLMNSWNSNLHETGSFFNESSSDLNENSEGQCIFVFPPKYPSNELRAGSINKVDVKSTITETTPSVTAVSGDNASDCEEENNIIDYNLLVSDLIEETGSKSSETDASSILEYTTKQVRRQKKNSYQISYLIQVYNRWGGNFSEDDFQELESRAGQTKRQVIQWKSYYKKKISSPSC